MVVGGDGLDADGLLCDFHEVQRAIDAVIDETMAARARAEAGDIGAFFEFSAAFAEFERTCTTLERLAADRGIDVALSCVDE